MTLELIKTEPAQRVSIYDRTEFTIDLRPVAAKQTLCPPGFWPAHSRLLDDADARIRAENYLNPRTKDAIVRINSLVRLFETVQGCHKDYLDILSETAELIKDLAPHCKIPFTVNILYQESEVDENERTVTL